MDAVRRLEAHEGTHKDADLAQARQRLHELEAPAYERLESKGRELGYMGQEIGLYFNDRCRQTEIAGL